MSQSFAVPIYISLATILAGLIVTGDTIIYC